MLADMSLKIESLGKEKEEQAEENRRLESRLKTQKSAGDKLSAEVRS